MSASEKILAAVQKADQVPYIGFGGGAATVVLGDINLVVGVLVGLLTAVYVAIKIFYLIRHGGNKDVPKHLD